MKYIRRNRILGGALVLAATCCFTASTAASVVLVNDTWQDSERNFPPAPTYSETGGDYDGDGDSESAWFQGGDGTLVPATGGPLNMATELAAGSSSWTTYFAREGEEVELLNAGDQLKITWQFTLSGVSTDNNSSQNMRIAVVDSPAASRLTSDGAPGSNAYSGYAIFANMGATLQRSDPWELMKRNDSAGNLLSTSSEWIPQVEDGDDEATGYANDTPYEMIITLTRTALDEIEFVASMSGGNLNGDGDLSATFLDTSPTTWVTTQPIPGGGFLFDTFSLRPSTAESTAEVFHTTLFRVEAPVPEPASLALIGLGGLALLGQLRRRR